MSSGVDNTCNKRFSWQLGELPKGYDHKYTYSHLGYNLKPLDIQAAIGRVQLRRLPSFIEQRKSNWSYLELVYLNIQVSGLCPPLTAYLGTLIPVSVGPLRMSIRLLLVRL